MADIDTLRMLAGKLEVTLSIPAETRDFILALLDENERLRAAGRELANVAYNIAQLDRADAGAIRSLRAAQLAWDAAFRAHP